MLGENVSCVIYENCFLICCEFLILGEGGEVNEVCNCVCVWYGLLLFYKDMFFYIIVDVVIVELFRV